MRIRQARIYKYRLPLTNPLSLKQFRLCHREGLLLELTDAGGTTAYGEAAPLPGFSRETISNSLEQLTSVLPVLSQKAIGKESFACSEQVLLPSVAFAVEGAIHSLGNPQSTASPSLSPLLSGERHSLVTRLQEWSGSWPAEFKLKVGRQPLQEDIQTAITVLELLPKGTKLRLDANRSWTTADVCSFAREIDVDRISYIEEPTEDARCFPGLYQTTGLCYALDETVQEPDYAFRPEEGLAALVIKPTLVGGVSKCRQLVREASRSGVRSVFSSSFESQIGVNLIARLSSELVPDEEPGLDTLSAFARPLCEALPESGASLPCDVLESMELLWQL